MKNTKRYCFITWIVTISYFMCRILPIIPNWVIFYKMTKEQLWADVFIGFKLLLIIATLSLDVLNIHWYALVLKSFKKYLKEQSDLKRLKTKQNQNTNKKKSG